MKVMLFGAGGQVGRLIAAQSDAADSLVSLARRDVDIADAGAVRAAVDRVRPDCLINVAAYTAVDAAEPDTDEAFRINADGAANLATAAVAAGARLIHVSTDFVFDGKADAPYEPMDRTNPLSVYGASKRAGEERVLDIAGDQSAIVRSAWLYSAFPGNFVTTMLRLMSTRPEVRVVNDQVGSPTWAASLADVLLALAGRADLAGIYHWVDAGEASWYDLAAEVRRLGIARGLVDPDVSLQPIPSSEYPVAARRPSYSVLDSSALCRDLGREQVPWADQLALMFDGLGKE